MVSWPLTPAETYVNPTFSLYPAAWHGIISVRGMLALRQVTAAPFSIIACNPSLFLTTLPKFLMNFQQPVRRCTLTIPFLL